MFERDPRRQRTIKKLAALRRPRGRTRRRLAENVDRTGRVVQRSDGSKAEHGQDRRRGPREREILERLTAANPGPAQRGHRDIFQHAHRQLPTPQKRIRVSYFGPEATYTHQAALKHFGRGAEFLPEKSIADVFDDVESSRADYGVVPSKKIPPGRGEPTLDMFMESDLVICAGSRTIAHCLMTAPGGQKIKAIHSSAGPGPMPQVAGKPSAGRA